MHALDVQVDLQAVALGLEVALLAVGRGHLEAQRALALEQVAGQQRLGVAVEERDTVGVGVERRPEPGQLRVCRPVVDVGEHAGGELLPEALDPALPAFRPRQRHVGEGYRRPPETRPAEAGAGAWGIVIVIRWLR